MSKKNDPLSNLNNEMELLFLCDNMSKQIDKLNLKIKHLEESIKNKDETIQKKDDQLQQKEEEIENLTEENEMLQFENEELKEFQSQYQNQQRQYVNNFNENDIINYQQQIKEKDREIGNLKKYREMYETKAREKRQFEEENNILRAEKSSLDEYCQQLEKEKEEMEKQNEELIKLLTTKKEVKQAQPTPKRVKEQFVEYTVTVEELAKRETKIFEINNKNYQLTLYPSLKNGTQFKMKNEGIYYGEICDLIIQINVDEQTFYSIENDDLYYKVSISKEQMNSQATFTTIWDKTYHLFLQEGLYTFKENGCLKEDGSKGNLYLSINFQSN